MQIFVLAGSPEASARNLCDQHVGVQIKELAQILSTFVAIKEGRPDTRMYKPTHTQHPCVQWLLREPGALDWGLAYALALDNRYQETTKSRHRSAVILDLFCDPDLDEKQPHKFVQGWQSSIPYLKRLMTRQTAVKRYRKYYIQKLTTWAQRGKKITWTGVPRPEWINVGTEIVQ